MVREAHQISQANQEEPPIGDLITRHRYDTGLLPGEELPETKETIARELSLNLSEYIEYIPEDVLYEISYKIAARVMELMSGNISSSLEKWRSEHKKQASIGDIVLQTTMGQMDKIAIPREVDPEKYIKEMKKRGPWSKIFKSKEKQNQAGLAIYQLVIDGVERYEALTHEASETLKRAKEEASIIVTDAKSEERATRDKLEKLRNDIVALRAEAENDPGLIKVLEKMDAQEREDKIEVLERRALDGVNTIENMLKTVQAKEKDLEKNTERVKEFLEMLRLFDSEILTTLQTVEDKFGIHKRIKLAGKIVSEMRDPTFSRIHEYDTEVTLRDSDKARLVEEKTTLTYRRLVTKDNSFKYMFRLDGQLFIVYVKCLVKKAETVAGVRQRLETAFSEFYSQENPDIYDINATINSLVKFR